VAIEEKLSAEEADWEGKASAQGGVAAHGRLFGRPFGKGRLNIHDPCQKNFALDLLKLFPGFQIFSASP
jgi:hypothetical protein